MVLVVVVATAGMCAPERDRPVPTPDELGAEALPATATVGGLDAVYVSEATSENAGGEPCFSLVRLAAAGEVRWFGGCSRQEPQRLAERDGTWEDDDVDVGDYAVDGERIWLRLVTWDWLTGENYAVRYEGVRCGDRLHLRDVASRSRTNLLAFGLLDPGGPPGPDCEQPTYRVEQAADRTVAGDGRTSSITMLTDPGATCSLAYEGPDGRRWPETGTSDVTADADGRCVLEFPVGVATGTALVSVTIGLLTHEHELDLV
jgi:hypothetical protein